jgi:hypothetical protein
VPGEHLVEPRVELTHLCRSSDESRRRGVGSLGAVARRGRIERRILAQDRSLEIAERTARLDTELVEGATCLLVRLEGLRLAAGAVEGEHELVAKALAQRVRGDQAFELADQVSVAAERELGIKRSLDRVEAELLQARNLRLREPVASEVGKRLAAP